ncbi:class I SAM-dependent methyltransferase [Evansella clarkii]|uniref:class I SAM-dependent methyltransferase n=1 Tax=Evansella clarkii TaxID=79879 RepID=UPI000B4544A3|nr:class I SAM-dependent methyltransferase [Evansella clarkii]
MGEKDVISQFGKSAKAYVDSSIHKKGSDLQKLKEITGMTGEEQVLDVATGGGHTANALAPAVKHVTALDVTPEMLNEAEQFITGQGNKNVSFTLGKAEQLPFPDESFDIVTCRIAAHHFSDTEKFVKEVSRVLKKEGQFILDDNVAPEDEKLDEFYNKVEKLRDYSHQRAYKKSEWLKQIELTGFKISDWYSFEKTFKFDSWCDRMQLPAEEKEELNDIFMKAPKETKNYFNIKTDESGRTVSFQGEAILLRAVKR